MFFANFNEIMIVLCLYIVMQFLDPMVHVSTRVALGMMFIIIAILVLILNIANLFYIAGLSAWKKYTLRRNNQMRY